MKTRIQSIDAYRGLTMLLMIWVNDFWTLSDIPKWLLHVSADTDGMGFSDVIFPVFLFIVGLSIPFAIRARRKKGESALLVSKHILTRSAALILMGVLMVNLESYHEATAVLSKTVWQVVMIAAFFLIWNQYPTSESWKTRALALQCVGWLFVGVLLLSFRSNPEDGYNWIEPHWWGILGLIGWSYLVSSFLALLAGRSLFIVLAGWLGLSLINVAAFAQWLGFLDPLREYVWIVGDGSLPAITLAGCFASSLFLRFREREAWGQFCLSVLGLGLACVVVGFLLRPLGGISKIHATPSWTQICAGIGLISFAIIYWLVDRKQINAWCSVIAPAGAATLTCYLLPYWAYPLMDALGLNLPEALTTGALGLLKSLVFAFAIVGATGLLNRIGIKLAI